MSPSRRTGPMRAKERATKMGVLYGRTVWSIKMTELNMSRTTTIKKTRNTATTTSITRFLEHWMIFLRVT